MYDEDILINENRLDLLKLLFIDGVIDELNDKGYKINYFGEKNKDYLESLIQNYPIDESNIENIQNILKNQEDERNYYIYIKYKNLYIGGLSIFDFQSREGFGLNKYLNKDDESFYIGQWEANEKNGIGFLKIDENHLYFGKFKENQINGEGLFFNKENGNYFFGLFNKGEIMKGLYINLNKDIYYFGNFFNGKKNDDFSIYINYKKKSLFLGQVQNDVFIKGYIIIFKIAETKKRTIIKIKNIVKKSKDAYCHINIKQNEHLEKFIFTFPRHINNLKAIIKNVKIILSELGNIYNDNIYNNRIGRYNSTENSFSFENEILSNYENYSNAFNKVMKEINIQSLKNEILL